MRSTPSHPARQLHSVSGRFAMAAVAWSTVDRAAPAPPTLVREAAPKKVSRRATSGLARDGALQRVEAILFLTREPLTSRKLCQYANLADATEARTLIRRLNELYDRGGRAFRVEEVAGGFQLLTRTGFATWLRRLGHVPAEIRLSAPALETLAVIAYRQPVPRADIEAIRGVNCGEILRQLMERDLVRISGRSEDLGRPYLYGTTKRFLQMFGLVNLTQLPRSAALRAPLSPTTGLPAPDTSRSQPSQTTEPSNHS